MVWMFYGYIYICYNYTCMLQSAQVPCPFWTFLDSPLWMWSPPLNLAPYLIHTPTIPLWSPPIVSDQIKIKMFFSGFRVLNFQKCMLICHTPNIETMLEINISEAIFQQILNILKCLPEQARHHTRGRDNAAWPW